MRVIPMAAIGGIVAGMMGSAVLPALVEAEVSAEIVARAQQAKLAATRLPDLGEIGYAGLYAGVSSGALLAAGGTNFPDAPPWKQGKKAWYDQIWALTPGAETWRQVGKLERPRALGACVTVEGLGVLCIGGGDDKQVLADAFVLRFDPKSGQASTSRFPDLPKPLMASSAAVAAGRVYVVGGHEQLGPLAGDGPPAEVWSIDPAKPPDGWRREPPIPSAGRYLPVLAGDDRCLYVFSGMSRVVSPEGKPALHCLADAWRLTCADGKWERLVDLPRGNAAAPGPAPIIDGRFVLLGGGVDDTNLTGPMDQRPPFPPTALGVDPQTGETSPVGEVRSSVVAASVAPWNGGFAVISGEVRAGVRTPEVWLYRAGGDR